MREYVAAHFGCWFPGFVTELLAFGGCRLWCHWYSEQHEPVSCCLKRMDFHFWQFVLHQTRTSLNFAHETWWSSLKLETWTHLYWFYCTWRLRFWCIASDANCQLYLVGRDIRTSWRLTVESSETSQGIARYPKHSHLADILTKLEKDVNISWSIVSKHRIL